MLRLKGPERLPWAVVLAAVILLAIPAFTAAQQNSPQDDQQQRDDTRSQDVAILTDGPEADRGIPFLSSNVIPHYRARYEYFDAAIKVYYTEKEIVRFSKWEEVRCGTYVLYRVTPSNSTTEARVPVYFYQRGEYALFVQISSEYLCTFLPRFMSKFIYFRSVQDLPTDRPPFPAIVD